MFPREHWAMFEEISVCHTEEGWVEIRNSLDNLWGTGQTPSQRMICPTMSLVLELRNLELKTFCFHLFHSSDCFPNNLTLKFLLPEIASTPLLAISWFHCKWYDSSISVFPGVVKTCCLYYNILSLIKDSHIWSPFLFGVITVWPRITCLLFFHYQSFK